MKVQELGSLLPGGYRVIDVLHGGMGVVYVCHQNATTADYAIKTPNPDKIPQGGKYRRFFEQEVRNWIRISNETRCDKIVRACSFDDDDCLLILEYIDGLAISQLARRREPVRPIHPRHFLSWSRDMAEALLEMHSRFGVVHRDIKPQNVLISTQLVAKVTDLGISKAIQENRHTATLVGTPAYMAPEIVKGEVSFRSDIYSYGATLFWMLTCEHAVPLDGALQKPLPEKAGKLLESCLQVDPQKRPGSFEQVLDRLAAMDESDFAWDPSHYSYCGAHRFFSPVPPPGRSDDDEEAPEEGAASCLLCTHAQYLDEQKTTILSRPSPEPGAETVPEESSSEFLDAPGGPAAQSTRRRGAMPTPAARAGATLSEFLAREPGAVAVTEPATEAERRALDRIPRARSRKRRLLVAAALLAGTAAVAGIWWPRPPPPAGKGGGGPVVTDTPEKPLVTPSSDDPPVTPSGDPPVEPPGPEGTAYAACSNVECGRAFTREEYQLLGQNSFRCKECGHRVELAAGAESGGG